MGYQHTDERGVSVEHDDGHHRVIVHDNHDSGQHIELETSRTPDVFIAWLWIKTDPDLHGNIGCRAVWISRRDLEAFVEGAQQLLTLGG